MSKTQRHVSAGLLVVIALSASTTATAGDANGKFAVKGVGALDCDAYIRAANAGDRELAQYSGYLAGYVSAYNEHRAETFDLLPWQSMETLMLIMLRRCRQVPDSLFAVAVSDMARHFDAGRLEELIDRIRYGDGDSAIELYEPVATAVLAALEERDYPTDDLYRSLQQYREDQDFPPATDNLQTAILTLLYTSGDR